ncbi:MAG: UvrD-helicase domain-containing protein, partial [Acidobacteria bacterium]|nr:UvrD-helicase domain-containing protein [Acidobacteriota bacterium]
MSSVLTARLPDEADRREAVTTAHHAFVWASAGTGKTHILTLRALYLLLNAPFLCTDGQNPGGGLYSSSSRLERLAAARKIIHSLALTTFTRKAAAEMQTRLNGYLNHVAAAQDLSELEGKEDPSQGALQDPLFHDIVKIVLKNLAGAKTSSGMPLFVELDEDKAFDRLRAGAQALTELAAELQISTIHSFATSILRRHPLQAGIPLSARFVKEDEDDLSGIDEQVVGRWWEQRELGQAGIQKDLEKLLQVVTVPQIRHWLKQCYHHRWILQETEALPLEDSDEEHRLVAAGYALVHALEKEDSSKLTRRRDRFKQLLDHIGAQRPGSWQALCQFIREDKHYFFSDCKSTKAVGRAQRKVEERNFLVRKNILEYDEVMDHQRHSFYGMRQDVLEGLHIKELIFEQIDDAVDDAVYTYLDKIYVANCIAEWIRENLSVSIDPDRIKGKDREDLHKLINIDAKEDAGTMIRVTIGEYLMEAIDLGGGEMTGSSEESSDYKGLSDWANATFKAG